MPFWASTGVARCRPWISSPSRSHLVQLWFWLPILLYFSFCAEWAVHSVICCWWHKGWIEFSCVLHSVRMVSLRFDDVSGCSGWAVPMVICCWWREFWRWREIRFFCVPLCQGPTEVWHVKRRSIPFFDVKSVVDQWLSKASPQSFRIRPWPRPYWNLLLRVWGSNWKH